MDEILKDDRFKHIANDPRFKSIPRGQRKVKIDKRFQSMFNDKRFKVKYTVDKRGRPINRTSTEDLEKFYQLTSGSEDEESDAEEEKKKSKKKADKKLKTTRQIEDEKESHPAVKAAKKGKDKKNGPSLKKMENRGDSGNEEEEEDGDDEDEDDDDDDDDSGEEEGTADESNGEDEEDDSIEIRTDDEDVADDVKAKLNDMSVDYARGEGAILSDSSSDDLTEESEDEGDDLVHGWGELDRDADRVQESTRRLALCNMDWDRIRATDIMVLLNSFIPPGGVIHSVTVYPSDYGLERMKREQERGPLELYGGDGSEGSGGEDEEANDDNKYHMEKLRQYQLNRLRYYYAIIECDTVATADFLYKECDGREYESSATRLDLRFVPDDTTFDQEPRECCTEMPDVRKYKPRSFLTTALQQSKVDLTWDETDPDRAALTSRVASGDIDDDDLKAYLVSSTDDSEEEEEEEVKGEAKKAVKQAEKRAAESDGSEDENSCEEGEENGGVSGSDESDEDTIAKYRRALESTAAEEEEEKRKDVQMEITWDVGLQKAAEEVVKKKLEEKEERTPFQEMLHRRREKQKEKRRQKAEDKGEEANSGESSESDDYIPADVDLDDPYFKEEYDKLGIGKKKRAKKEDDEEDAEKKKWAQLRSSKKLKQKKTRRELEEEAARESNFQVDVKDERFSALYTSHLFNIDPTDPNFRKTGGVEALINEKLERRTKQSKASTVKVREEALSHQGATAQAGSSDHNTKNSELSDLVSSIKNKTKIFQKAKKRKLNEN